MDKRIAGLLGAAAALTTVTAANAAVPVQGAAVANTYQELLAPVPNAVAALKAEDAQRAGQTGAELSQFFYHHHHHHHHHWWRRYRHHHHHHHHHHHYLG